MSHGCFFFFFFVFLYFSDQNYIQKIGLLCILYSGKSIRNMQPLGRFYLIDGYADPLIQMFFFFFFGGGGGGAKDPQPDPTSHRPNCLVSAMIPQFICMMSESGAEHIRCKPRNGCWDCMVGGPPRSCTKVHGLLHFKSTFLCGFFGPPRGYAV